LLIPATDDFVEEIDDEKREITMNLPDGLLDM
jgi:ribosomal 30S subunit maturation factor RimM